MRAVGPAFVFKASAANLLDDRPEANLFFQLISRRYKRGPMPLTSSQSFAAVGDLLGDRVIMGAVIVESASDRLVGRTSTLYGATVATQSGMVADAEPVEDPQRALGAAHAARADRHRVIVIERQHRYAVLAQVDRHAHPDGPGTDDDHRPPRRCRVGLRRPAVLELRIG